jgi:ketol-acid reductoisomerase
MPARAEVHSRFYPRSGNFRHGKLISDTAKWGDLTVGPKIIDKTVQRRMRSVLQKIRSGQFAREFIREMKTGRTRYQQLLREAENPPIEKVGARLRGMMAWRAKK